MKLRGLALNVVFATLYALVYWRCYVAFLHPHFGYAGYDLFQREPLFLATSLGITILPVLCYRGIRAVSSAIAVFTYLLLYVPIIITFALGSSRSLDEIVAIQLTFLAGMTLLFLADLAIIRNPIKLELGIDLMPLVLALTIVSTAYILYVYREGLAFSSFGNELYELRAANVSLGAGLVTRYVSSWLTTVFIPLCLSFGLRSGRHRYTIAGVIACLSLYMGAANKLVILLPFVYVGFYLVLRKRLSAMLPVAAVGLSAIITTLAAMTPGTTAFFAAGIVLHRTIGNGGQLTMAYYDFFSFYARTGLSHVHGLNLFTRPYPYGSLEVGQVVGQFYWSPDMNANANFWATDGIAGLGLSGVVVISVLAAGLFVVMNSVTRRHDLFFSVLCFLPFVTTLLNQSLFSSFWSGGAFFLIVFFTVNRRVTVPARARTASARAAAYPHAALA